MRGPPRLHACEICARARVRSRHRAARAFVGASVRLRAGAFVCFCSRASAHLCGYACGFVRSSVFPLLQSWNS
eukprot:13238529-Alexandrium_andersonii.AAC.1